MKTYKDSYGELCSLFYDATKGFAPDAEVSFYAEFIGTGRGLEAMCGSGRLLIPLLRRGYAIEGVDNSSIMLKRCSLRCSEFNLSPSLIEQSLVELQLEKKYDVITIAVGSFQLITEREDALNALKKMRDHLNRNGILLIDFFTPDLEQELRSIRTVKLDKEHSIKLTTRHIFDTEQKRADAYSDYELIKNNEVIRSEQELLSVVWYSDEELAKLLSEAGFELKTVFNENFRASGPSYIAHAVVK